MKEENESQLCCKIGNKDPEEKTNEEQEWEILGGKSFGGNLIAEGR